MGKKRKKRKSKRANTDHIAHQVNVTGVGPHKNKKKQIPRKRKYKGKERYDGWR